MTIQEEIKKKLETYPNEFEDERNACEVGDCIWNESCHTKTR